MNILVVGLLLRIHQLLKCKAAQKYYKNVLKYEARREMGLVEHLLKGVSKSLLHQMITVSQSSGIYIVLPSQPGQSHVSL